MDLFQNRNFVPMLLSETDKPFDDEDYLFELKLDGTRTLIYVDKTKVLIKNRRGNKLNELYPELHNIKKIVKKKTIFDGEIILMYNGKPSFEKLQNRAHLKDKNKINYYAKELPVIFVAYDLLYDGEDITHLPLIERKKRLNQFKNSHFFIKSRYIYNKGVKFYNETKKRGLEGIVAKKKDSIYQINKRTKDWIKIKNLMSENYYIYGYKETETGLSIIIVNSDYKYIGKVSLNKSNPDYLKIKKQPINKNPYFIKEGYQSILPYLMCKVEFMTKTPSGSLRQPIYRGLI